MQREPSGKRVLLAGASGYIGQSIARALLDRGYRTTLICRPSARQALTTQFDAPIQSLDLLDAQDCAAQLGSERWDTVISCIASRTGVADDAWAVDYQANANLLTATRSGRPDFLLLSAICVQRPMLAFQRAKLRFESELAASGTPFNVIRPTAFFKSLAGQIQRLQAGKPFLLFGDGALTACKPISARDVARFFLHVLETPDLRNQTLPVGGPDPALTARQQGEMLFRLLGKPAQFRSVPPALLSGLAATLKPIGRLSKGAQQKSELLRIGHYYATQSMLVWDEDAQRYSADATPEFGEDRLEDYYATLIREGMQGESLGEQKLF